MNSLHGGDRTSLERERPGLPVLDFSANINPLGLPESARRALESSADSCLHYPDPCCGELREAIGRLEGVDFGQILCGNGAAELIYRIAWGFRPKTALVFAPTFSEYGRALEAAGCAVRCHRLRAEAGFVPDASLLEDIPGAELVFLCNPNNPTGALLEPELLEAVLLQCVQGSATLVVDECFLDFVAGGSRYSMKPHLAAHPNLIVLRAFTKIFAMPGLRLGYALCGDSRRLALLERAGPPWSVSVPAQLCGVAAAGERDYISRTRQMVAQDREQLQRGLAALGCTVFPGAANFFLFRARSGLAHELRGRGILLRDCTNFPGLGPGYYRTAVRTAEENTILLNQLKELDPCQTY